ncbi:MAG: hypothetical protein IPG45_27605 [Deltaproteobacteria bacterium]|nr:hypothetical protein [Deltaproteobacteria bacterium]
MGRRGSGVALVLLGLWWPGAAVAEVRVRSNSPCVEAQPVVERLESLLRGWAGGAQVNLQLLVVAEAERERTRLLVSGRDSAGELLLEREFDLVPGACPSALALLETVVEGAIRDLPVEAWTQPAAAPLPPPSPDPWRLRLKFEPDLGLLATSAHVGLGASLMYGSGDQALGVGLLASTGWSGALGQGTPLMQRLLLEAAWAYDPANFGVSAGLRSGLLWVTGVGYGDNDQAVAFWWEAFAQIFYRFGPLGLGVGVALAPLDHQLSTRSGELRRVSPIRFGPHLVFDL